MLFNGLNSVTGAGPAGFKSVRVVRRIHPVLSLNN
jgi:hypothetical protein